MEKQLPKDYKIQLAFDTPQEWVDSAIENFDKFLIDHADNERKASNMALGFIAKAPEKVEIIPDLIDIALEELVHFKQVFKIMTKRGLAFPKQIEKDEYVNRLIKSCRSGWKERFLDRLLIASIVETRGAERFRLIAENHPEMEMQSFYTMLYKSEDRHGNIFVEMGLIYYEKEEVMKRLEEMVQIEAEICASLPFNGLVH
ncbi:MAG: tRNA-(ms[2]io[6]A)-hydroxylase [Salibacteraceae bacterium]